MRRSREIVEKVCRLPAASFFHIPMFWFIGFHFFLLLKPRFPESWYDHQRLVELIIITVSTVFMLFFPPRGGKQIANAVLLVGLVFVLVLVAHRVSSPMLVEVLHSALLVVFVVWWAEVIRAFRLSDALLLSFQLATASYVVVSLLRLFASLSNGVLPDPFDFFQGFVNPRFFGAWVTLSWPLMLLHTRPSDGVSYSSLNRLLLLVLAALWWSLAFFSGTRATWLAAIVVLSLMAACSSQSRRLVMRAALVTAIGYALHYLLFVQLASWMTGLSPADALERLQEGFALSQRDVLWRLALQGILERPWFGAGPMMFSATNNGIASTTHNIFLQLAYEWGIPFALLILTATARVLRKQYLRCRIDGHPLRLALWMCVVGALVEAQFDSLLSAPHSQFLFAILCGWMLSVNQPAQLNEGAPVAAWRFLRFAPLLMAVALWWAINPELSSLEAWEQETFEVIGVGHYQPRFWLQGVVLVKP